VAGSVSGDVAVDQANRVFRFALDDDSAAVNQRAVIVLVAGDGAAREHRRGFGALDASAVGHAEAEGFLIEGAFADGGAVGGDDAGIEARGSAVDDPHASAAGARAAAATVALGDEEAFDEVVVLKVAVIGRDDVVGIVGVVVRSADVSAEDRGVQQEVLLVREGCAVAGPTPSEIDICLQLERVGAQRTRLVSALTDANLIATGGRSQTLLQRLERLSPTRTIAAC
jgi:hypothetical protein